MANDDEEYASEILRGWCALAVFIAVFVGLFIVLRILGLA